MQISHRQLYSKDPMQQFMHAFGPYISKTQRYGAAIRNRYFPTSLLNYTRFGKVLQQDFKKIFCHLGLFSFLFWHYTSLFSTLYVMKRIQDQLIIFQEVENAKQLIMCHFFISWIIPPFWNNNSRSSQSMWQPPYEPYTL